VVRGPQFEKRCPKLTRRIAGFVCPFTPPLHQYRHTVTGRSGDRIPVGARFFAHVQNGPGAHPASCTMGTGSFPGVKRPARGADHPPPSSAGVKKIIELYLYPPSWTVQACDGTNFYYYYYCCYYYYLLTHSTQHSPS
jgi:hypothetical protein